MEQSKISKVKEIFSLPECLSDKEVILFLKSIQVPINEEFFVERNTFFSATSKKKIPGKAPRDRVALGLELFKVRVKSTKPRKR